MYKLYTDKTEIFECKVKIDGASLSNSKARLIIESEDLNLLFNGRIDEHGNLGIGGSSNIGLGTSTPRNKLHVEGIVFHVNDRRLEMAGDENGDFKINWLDKKENESASSIIIHKPKDDPWKTNSIAIH